MREMFGFPFLLYVMHQATGDSKALLLGVRTPGNSRAGDRC